eukprot:1675526-Rhodomonas_salina.1
MVSGRWRQEATHVNVLDKCCQHIEGCPKRPAYGEVHSPRARACSGRNADIPSSLLLPSSLPRAQGYPGT